MPNADQIVISLVPQTLTVIRHVADALQSSAREVVETMVSDFLCGTLCGRLSQELVNLTERSGAYRHEAWCRVYRAYVRWVHTPSASDPRARMTLPYVTAIDPAFDQLVRRGRKQEGKDARRGRKPNRNHGRLQHEAKKRPT
jgi:hypothetical protein